jgi:tetratricopeptide (TPR) repeat protein
MAQPSAAEKLIEGGHWKRARALVEARIHEGSRDALANYLLSQIRNAFGDHATPLPLAEKAVALDSHTAKYHRQLAEVLGVTAQHASAIQQFFLAQRFRKEIDAALALDPRDTQALRDLLEFYLVAPGIAGGDPPKADSLASRIGEIQAPLGFLAAARIAAFHKQDAETDIYLRKAAEALPPNYGARIALAAFYMDQAHFNPTGAQTQARAALKLDPTRVDAYAVMAETLADRGDRDELESALATAAAAVPDDLVPYYRAADRLLTQRRDPARAERYLRVYLDQEPEGNEPTAAEAHWKLGLVLQSAGRTEEAAKEWKESVRLDPESKAALELERIHRK